MVSPEALWRSWRRSRQAEAFEALVRPHLPYVADVARRQGIGADLAEDVVQETLLELAREKSDEPVRVGVRPWLARRVRFRAKKTVRSSVRRRKHEGSARQPRAGRGAEQLEVKEEVEAALALLPAAERQAVVLRYLHDMEYAEIGYVLGTSENACRIKVSRGINRLRRSLGGHAAALVAALGLPAVAEAALVEKSVAAAASTSVVKSAAFGGGGLVVSSGVKLAGAAIVGAAITAVGMLAWNEGDEGDRAAASRESVARRDDGAGAGASRRGALADLDVTADEAVWVRETLQRERVRRENARIRPEDSGLDILKRRIEWDADVGDLVRDYERFAAHVRPEQAKVARFESKGDVTEVDLDAEAGGAAVLEFGPGTFQLSRKTAWFHMPREDVRSLEIRGAGKERTVIIGASRDFLMATKRIEHLRFRDLTYEGGDNAMLLDIRGEVAVLLDGVQIRGWPGGGHSSAIGLSGGAYLGARDCEFLGGYAARGGGSGAVSIRGTAVASFERCLFADVDHTIAGWGGAAEKSVVHFEDCVWENTRLTHSGFLHRGSPEFPVTVRGGRAHWTSAEAWGAGFAAQVEGVAFAPRIPRCTLADLLRAARAVQATLDDGQRLQSVYAAFVNRDPARDFVVYINNSPEYLQRMRERRVRARSGPIGVTLAPGGLEVWPEERARRLRSHHSGVLSEGARDFGDVVSRAGLDPALEAYGIVHMPFTKDDKSIPSVQLSSWRGSAFLILNGVTGEMLQQWEPR